MNTRINAVSNEKPDASQREPTLRNDVGNAVANVQNYPARGRVMYVSASPDKALYINGVMHAIKSM